jgi:hypothetical protein
MSAAHDETADPGAPERQRPLVGLAYGTLAAALAALGWYLASIGTKSALLYLTVAVGVAVGYFVNVGARIGNVLTAAMAVVLTFVGSVAGFYLVSRASLIRRGYVRLTGSDPSIPATPSYRLVRDVLRESLRGNIGPYLYLLVALVVAGYLGLRGLDPAKRRAEH